MDDDSPIERSDVVRRSPEAAAPEPTSPERNPNVQRGSHGDDERADTSLRPQSFDEFIGQRPILENLLVMVKSASMRGDTLDHVLFCGPPGLGKTTLAHILSKEMGVNIHVTSGPALEKKGDLAGILSSLEEGDMLFIDECHRLNAVVEENLYPAMEDYYFDIVIGNGPTARSMKLSLPPFTLVGATTRAGLVTAPLRSRFGQIARLKYYNDEQLSEVVKRSARLLEIGITEVGAHEIASRSRGTPRIANRLLRRVRDYAVVDEVDAIDADLADYALAKLNVDHAGFDSLDRLYLKALTKKFGGGPAGLSTLASAIDEEKDTIETVIEPYLLQQGYIQRTPQGRVATRLSFDHMNEPYPQGSLL